ncbi:glucose dehydrogenase [FAD, quinone]-like [Anthonomus grandis grandis]|uniref:glucose dehydrogenase [FAD, quinone]-like n=1 Tax=Anthonomus grandis grandis TaxID=2921223 RepID=UPI002165EA17|nr:glucose dehydrogenase [FAD, quinone]-like [Anthonomus grandis grandis]XP_050302391.1 glucose dehydrogenase [FAD, quinone]-like [Anthonomus grandis grandis]XP_050302392.1 glucose dehydrogenase [FAD, quinone]-like [Anthonomus grandis grandis]
MNTRFAIVTFFFFIVNIVRTQDHDNSNDPLSNMRKARFVWPNYIPTPPMEHSSKYLYNDPPPTNEETFDFIIVGSGSGGAPLANRLSENPKWKILLLELGDVAPPIMEIPALAPLFQKTKYDWAYMAEKENGSCWGCPNQRMHWPRGRGLGGTTLINFMISIRGNKLDYDRWEAMGNPGWSYNDVLPYFKKMEDARVQIQDAEYRNKGGYMTVSDIPYKTKSIEAFVQAAQEAGYPYVDYNGRDQMGVSFVQGNIRNGLRCSVEKAYLRPIRDRKNLKILINSRVTKILIDPKTKRAYGVIFIRNKKYYKITATKEVILSAGAFNSPQLLMLSGIGPKSHLEELEIPVIQDLPVGQKMYDHITFIGLNFLVNESIVANDREYYNPKNIIEYLGRKRGVYTILGGVEGLLYFKTNASREIDNYPDMEVIFIGSNVAADRGVIFKDTMSISQELYNAYWKEIETKPFFQTLLMLVHPKSYGYLRLKSKNPFHWPKFYPRYFTDKNNDDIKTFIASIRKTLEIIKMPALQRYRATLYEKPMPGCEKHTFNSDEYWECALRTITPTLHHQVATCKMGPVTDPEAVVDHRLRVHGIKNLRVVDTSIIPLPLTAHTNIPTVMISEKAADMLKEEWENKIDIRLG